MPVFIHVTGTVTTVEFTNVTSIVSGNASITAAASAYCTLLCARSPVWANATGSNDANDDSPPAFLALSKVDVAVASAATALSTSA